MLMLFLMVLAWVYCHTDAICNIGLTRPQDLKSPLIDLWRNTDARAGNLAWRQDCTQGGILTLIFFFSKTRRVTTIAWPDTNL